jgi:hypothetical protein
MATGPEPPEQTFTAADVAHAERRAAEARERAAHAGLSAAQSIEESARYHERVAKVQDVTVEQGASEIGVHQASARKHRQAAVDDHKLAEEKRKESEADLNLGTER